jgi:hypothetical protein
VFEISGSCDEHILGEWHVCEKPRHLGAHLAAIDILVDDDEQVDVTIVPSSAPRLRAEQDDPLRLERRDDPTDGGRPSLADPGLPDSGRWSVESSGFIVAADPARDDLGPRGAKAPFRKLAQRSSRGRVGESERPTRARPRDDPASVSPVVARWIVERERPLAWAIWVSVASSDSSSAMSALATGSVIRRSIASRLSTHSA